MSGTPHDDDRSPGDESATNDAHASADGNAPFATDSEMPDTPAAPTAEVLSGVMDDHDPEATGELELPDIHEDLDPKPAKSDAGFDGWLDTDDPDGDNPYEALADDGDDAASEIADWMAFTSGEQTDESPDEPDVVVDVTDAAVADEDEHADTGEVLPDEPESGDTADEGHQVEETGESPEAIDEGEGSADTSSDHVEGSEPGGDEEQDLDELMVLPAVSPEDGLPGEEAEEGEEASPADTEAESTVEPFEAPETADEAGEAAIDAVDDTGEHDVVAFSDDDTGEHDVVAFSDDDTGEHPVVAEFPQIEGESEESAAVFDFEEFTEDDYLPTATREHQDLAAAIAAAEGEETEQVALAAAIPGLDSGVVGFDDVVATEEGEASADVKPPASSDLVLRVGTAVALLGAFFLSLMWRPALIVLALAAFVVAAGEFYSVLVHRGYKPVSIFGFLGIIGAGLGTVVWGVIAIPVAFAVMITAILLFDAVSRRRKGAVSGFATTIFVAAWIGGFGSFAFAIIASENFRPLVLAVVVTVALVDIAAYFVGSAIGRRKLAPVVSPKKTVEGLIGGTLMAFVAGVVASFFIEAMDLPAGLVFGAIVAVFAPLGDLAVSVAKRSLAIKDMGSILPGHGGLLDRIDAIIAVVPAAWAAFAWMGLL